MCYQLERIPDSATLAGMTFFYNNFSNGLLGEEGALDKPEEAGEGDEDGGCFDGFIFPGLFADVEEEGESEGDDGELADFYAEVEGEEGDEEAVFGEAEFAEGGGEAEAVDESEEEGEEPTRRMY